MLIESDQRHRLTLTPLLRNSIEALHLLLGGNTGLKTEVLLEGTVVVDVLEVAAILEDTVRLLGLSVLLAVHVGETPLLRDDDLLATSELVSRSAESLENNSLVAVTGAHREEDLANVDTGNGVVGLAVSTTHTGLEPIGTSARKHLVDTDNVERMNTHAKVERVLTRGLGDVLVGTDTGSLESLRSDLLVFVTDEVGTEGEIVDGSLLTAKIVDTDLGVGHTTVVPRLGERLVLAVAVAAGWSSSHLEYCWMGGNAIKSWWMRSKLEIGRGKGQVSR